MMLIDDGSEVAPSRSVEDRGLQRLSRLVSEEVLKSALETAATLVEA